MKTRAVAFGALAAVCGLAFSASASVLIDAGPASSPQTFTTGNYVAGSEFTLAQAMTIRSLGWLDAEGDGLTHSHMIGVWDVATQSLLASGTVIPGGGFTLPSAHGTAIWHMVVIPDLLLPAGTYRVAGEVNGDNVALSDDQLGAPGVTVTAGYVRTAFPSGGFAYPNLTFCANAIRATVSTVIPAPGAVLVLAGLLPLARRRRA
jgi:hypothetical protein